MSRTSKAKRDQRKKKQAKRPFQRLDREQPVANHAVLQSEDGRVVAALGRQADGQWILGIGGQSMGGGDDPLPMLVMLKHLADLQQKDGNAIRLDYSELLRQRLEAVAAESGQSAEDYLAARVAEFNDSEDEAANEAQHPALSEPAEIAAEVAADATDEASTDAAANITSASDTGAARPA